jgi:hypothetical protein
MKRVNFLVKKHFSFFHFRLRCCIFRHQNQLHMQEPMFPSTITHKLYNERAVLIGTFLGGPLVGAYLIGRNFKALDEPASIGKTWLLAVGLLLFAVALGFIPGLEKIPAFVYSFGFCMAAHSLTKKYQGSRIALHQTAGGQLYSTGRAALIGVLGCVVMMGAFYGIFYLGIQSSR